MKDTSRRDAEPIEEISVLKQRIQHLEQLALDHRNTVEALKESEGRYRLAFDSTSDGIFTVDHHFRVSSITPSVEWQLGYKVEEILNKPIHDLNLLTPESLTRAVSDVVQVLSGKEVRCAVYEFIAKDGTRKIGEVTGTPIVREGKILGVTAVIRDVTEHRRMDEALCRSREAAERLAEEMAVIAEIGRLIGSTLNIEEVYERFTAEVRKLIDFDRLAINLSNVKENAILIAYVSGVVIDGRSQGDSLVLAGTLSEEIIRTRTGMLLQTVNTRKIVERFPPLAAAFRAGMRSLMAVPLIYRSDVIGILHFGSKKRNAYTKQDLSLAERIGIQITGAIANAQLFKDLSKTEKSLRKSEGRLKRAEKMEALGQLAGGVAHDLNNVLGVLSGHSELLLQEIPEGHRSRGHVDKILQSTGKAAAIINDLLTLARRGVTASEVINLNGVVTGFLKTPVFEKMKDYHPRVTFRTECDKNLLKIKGSAVHLEKTLMNLVSNAAEAITGKGKVTIRTESRHLDKAVRGYDEVKAGDYAVLTVSDTGMGIPAENREKIFEPFYTKKTMGRSGTGLGLTIVWGAVKDHNGYIDVQSEVGEGTTFTLYFPTTRENLIAQPQREPLERYLGRGESVLVVDDVAEQRDVAAGLLATLGYRVHAVSSGEEAVEYLKEKTSDIMVLDMIMAPGIDGLETYERILEFNPKQKTIIVSGFSETDQVRKAQKLGAGAYVRKPYTMEKIGAAIRDELLKGATRNAEG